MRPPTAEEATALLATILLLTLSLGGLVVAADANDGAPEVRWTQPWDTTRHERPPDETAVSDGTVTLAGTAVDADGIERVTVIRRYTQSTDDDSSPEVIDVEQWTRTPGEAGRFEIPVTLGVGDNLVNITLVDGVGNQRTISRTITVDDEQPPAVALRVSAASGKRRLVGRIRDNVQVADARLTVGNTVVAIDVGAGNRDVSKQSVFVAQRLPAGDPVRVTVWDTAGHSRTVTLPRRPTATATATATRTPAPTTTVAPTTPSRAPNATPTATAEWFTPTPTTTATAAGTTPSDVGVAWSKIAVVLLAIPVGFVVLKEVVA